MVRGCLRGTCWRLEMLRTIVLTVVAFALAVTTALAAPVTAKVTASDAEKITVTLPAEKPAWLKVGTAVKLKGLGPGKVTAIEGTTVTISSKKAAEAKVGTDLSIDKGGMSGC
jgi:uncharacterized membrane protein